MARSWFAQSGYISGIAEAADEIARHAPSHASRSSSCHSFLVYVHWPSADHRASERFEGHVLNFNAIALAVDRTPDSLVGPSSPACLLSFHDFHGLQVGSHGLAPQHEKTPAESQLDQYETYQPNDCDYCAENLCGGAHATPPSNLGSYFDLSSLFHVSFSFTPLAFAGYSSRCDSRA